MRDEPCQPYCSFFDVPEDPDKMPICDDCGALWELRDVTEIDPEGKGPSITRKGWVQVTLPPRWAS